MTLRISSGAGHAGGHGTGGKKDGSESPEGEKRRNKLGYQRASLACAHCRRRKIRCIVQQNSGSPQKCANCVRLRRECLFYPVEQQERMEGQRHQSVDNSPGSADSSPRNGGVDITTGARQYDNYTNATHGSGRSQSFNGVLIEPGRTQAPGGYMTHDHEYRAGHESYWQRANGPSSFNQAQTIHPAHGATGNYWSPQDTAIPGIYGPLQSDARNGMRSPYSSSMANAPLHAEQPWQQQQQQYGQRPVMSSLHGSGYSQPHVHHGGTEGGAYTHTPLPSQPDSRQHGAQMPSDGTGVNYTPERIRSASDAGPLVGIAWQQSYADQPHPPVSNGPVYTAPGAYAFYNNGSHGGSNGSGHNDNHDAATPGHYHSRS